MNDRINAWVQENTDKIFEDLKGLVSHPSTEGEPTEYPYGDGVQGALEYMLELGKEYGYETDNLDNQVGKIIYNPKAEKEVGVWAHLDVVLPGDGWQFEPYNMVIKDGYVFGRGVGDNKGPAIATLHAMRCLEELEIPINYKLVGFLGTNEETGMADLKYFRENHEAPDLSIIPDSSFPVSFGEKGVNTINITSGKLSDAISSMEGGLAHNIVPPTASATLKDGTVINGVGNSRHSAMPDGATNAIFDLMNKLLELDTLTESDREILTFLREVTKTHFGEEMGVKSGDEISGPLTCVGTMLSMEDNEITLSFNIRCPVMINEERIFEIMNNTALKNNFTAKHVAINKPHYFSGDPAVIDLLTDLYNKETGENSEPFAMAGGTYASKLPNAIGFGYSIPDTPRPDFIPKDHGGAHEADEFIHIDSYLQALEIMILGFIELNDYMA